MKKLIIIAAVFLLIVGVISATLATTAGAKVVEPESVEMVNNPSKPEEGIKEYKLVGMATQGTATYFGQKRQYGLSVYFTNPNDEAIDLTNLSVYAQDGTVIYDGDFVQVLSGPSYVIRSMILPHETITMRLQYYAWTGDGLGYDDVTDVNNWENACVVLNETFNHVINIEIEWEADKSYAPLVGYMSQQTLIVEGECVCTETGVSECSFELGTKENIPLFFIEQ